MSTETHINRKGRGPGGGQFAGMNRPSGTIDLATVLAPEPTAEQVERAQAEAQRRASIRGLGKAEAEDLADRFAHRLADQEAAYEAFKRGEAHPDDAAYAEIWEGGATGLSERDVQAALAHTIEQREQFDRGLIGPSDILPGYRADAAAAAVAHLDEKESLYATALDCGGRNLSTNQASVVAARHAAEAELYAAPF